MKKIYLLYFLLINIVSFSQNFGSFASGIKINNTIYNNTSTATVHNINQSASAQNFNNVNLGIFGVNSSCGIISGAEVKTFKNVNANVCSSNLFWRVYSSSSSPSGVFNSISLSTTISCNVPTGTFNDGFGPCGNRDQKWKDYSLTSSFVSGLLPGTYVLEIFFNYTGSNVSTTGCETTNLINNGGANYKANFTISNPISNPTATPNPICEGSILNLTANPNNGVAPYSYSWTGPNGYISSIQNPTITTTLNSAGIYSLIITDACGVSATSKSTQSVVVNSKIIPEFDAINPGLCKLGTPPVLPNLSTNGINGTWNPATVDNSTVGTFTYVFTPNSGECATTFNQNIFVINNVNPTFTLPASICEGSTPPTLQNNSNNGIQGTWSPTLISNSTSGTYTFTPNSGQCANVKNVTINVVPVVSPTFTIPTSICENSTPPTLPTTSDNGITGTWNPSVVNNTTSETYVFTYNPSQCSTNFSISIIVYQNILPTFTAIAPICENAPAPLLPSTSNNGVTGTWNPSTVSNTNSATYNFTPTAGLCALPASINVTVNPIVTPTFDPIPNVCYQTVAPTLPTTSNNGINGTWNPSTISNTASGSYTFTPNAGECAIATSINVIVDIITPTFDTVAPICSGSTVPNLQTTSNNGITGNWNPSTINNTTSGTYTFTPNANQCATIVSFSVTVNPNVTPTFNAIAPVCEGSTAPTLQNPSNNGISGTWNPATVSTATSGTFTFTFTPDSEFCATTTTLDVIINSPTVPTFNEISQICQNGNVPVLPTTSYNGISGTWNPATIDSSLSGTFTYVFTPNPNQCASSKSVDIVITPNVTPTFDTIPPICFGTSPTPSLPLISNNGISGTWNPSTISNTASGTYTFTPNSNLCVAVTTLDIIITPNIIPTFDAIPDVCYETTVPSLQTTSNNGITGTWNPSTINNTASGNYTFTPNANQCATLTTISVTVTIITPTFNIVPTVCFNSTPANLPTTSTNGITGIWNPSTINTTTANTYTFTPDANQCAPLVSITTTINTVTPTFNAIPTVCYGTTPPTLQTTSTNGITGTWNPATVDNTTSSSYTFTPDANQCATTATLNVTVNTITPTFTITQTICENATAPILPGTSNNGITGIWNPSIVSNTTTATYTFTPNTNQCAPNVSITVTVNSNVIPTFNDIAPVCYNATVPTLPSTSNNGITGTWNPSTVSNLVTNTYTFTPNSGVCAAPVSITITVNTINPTFNAIPAVCYGSTPPSLQTTSSNGITGSWNPDTISNTTAGTYTFTPDANQCATTASLTVAINTVIPTFTIAASICQDATAPTLSTTSDNSINGNWNPSVIDTTTSGTYTFTPDANQCATIVSLTVTVNPNVSPTFDPIGPVCYNTAAPTLPLTSTNGISGTWNPASVSNTTSGSYTFTPNSSQCATSISIIINVNTITPSFASFTTTAICENSSAPALPTTSDNAITGTWNPALVSTTMSNTYTFTPDANQCAITASISITVNLKVTPTFDAIPTICYNSTVPTLATTSTNGISGTWSPSIISNTAAATYTFTPDATFCANTTSITTTLNTVTPTFTTIAPVCYNATAPLLPTTSSNGITGSWNPSIINNLAPGDYTFTPDANQCATVVLISIGINVITPTFNPIAPVCYNATAPLLSGTSTNGISGTWNPATVSNLAGATYTFTPNANQCAVVITLPITINKVIPSFLSFTTTTICANTTAPVLPTTSDNGITGTWNSIVSNTTSTTYTFTPDANQCATTATITINVTVRTLPTFSFGTTASACQDSSIQVLLPNTSSNGISGSWLPSAIDYSILGTTSYTFTPNLTECATPTSYTVFVNPNIIPAFTAIAPICSGTTAPVLQLISGNGFTGTWNPSSISTTSSGNYVFTPTAGQCATTFTLPVTVYQSPTDITVLVSNVYNQSSTGVLEITGVTSGDSPFQYSLNNGTFTTQTTYTNLTPGDYSITVRDANGCEIEKTFTIESNCIFPNGISPNGDNKNDTFNLSACNVKRLELFNRYGTRINAFDNYLSQWDGTTSDGKELPDGTYFYTAALNDGTTKTGWVYLIRKN